MTWIAATGIAALVATLGCVGLGVAELTGIIIWLVIGDSFDSGRHTNRFVSERTNGPAALGGGVTSVLRFSCWRAGSESARVSGG